MLTIDFETLPFNPDNTPPKPVGVAVKEDNQPAIYYHWGHQPVEMWRGERGVNLESFMAVGRASKRIIQTTHQNAMRNLEMLLHRYNEVLLHNALFDLSLPVTERVRAILEHKIVHDTSWLLFLVDPNARELGLKPSSDRWLGVPPTEQDRMRDWLVEHVKRTAFERDALGMQTPRQNPSAWTAFAPPRIAGRYAIGDVDRTKKLYDKLRPLVTSWRMDGAYGRYQRAVFPILRMQERGVGLDPVTVTRQFQHMRMVVHESEAWIRKRLDAPDLNLGSSQQMVGVLDSAGVMDEEHWWKYPTNSGNLSARTDVLLRCCKDPQLTGALTLHSKAKFNVTTFLEKWARAGETAYARWSFTRNEGGGARTGRMSSSPNYQNIPKRVPLIVTTKREAAGLTRLGYPFVLLDHRLAKTIQLVPNLRECIVPRKGNALADADYSQQELRILAEYAGGKLRATYRKNPRTDMHGYAGESIRVKRRRTFPRVQVKNVGFGTVYRSGLEKLAEQLFMDPKSAKVIEEMRELREAYYEAMPEVRDLVQDLERNPQRNVTTSKMLRGPGRTSFGGLSTLDPLYTIGGRICFVEEPTIVNGERRSWQYKLLNTAVQGSAGDQIIEAITQLDGAGIEVVLPVHDQCVAEGPHRSIKRIAREMVQIMEHVTDDMKRPDGRSNSRAFTVPMIVDVDIRRGSWAG